MISNVNYKAAGNTEQVNTSPAAAGEVNAIEMLSVEKVYPNGTRALRPVDLKIKEGEFVTLLGPSGCGKSTLLKMIAGLEDTSDGRLLLWKKPVDQIEETGHSLSFVFQEASLMPWHSVRKNVSMALELDNIPSKEAKPRIDKALKLVGLDRFADALPRELSGGMQMRVSIARGLVVNPDLLLMDEPFGALDEITRFRLDSDLLDLWRDNGLTVVFVTHSIHEAVFLSQRVIVMAARPGRVVADIKIDEPFPRKSEFRMTQRFSEYAMQLHEYLMDAAAEEDQF
ncbi:MAG: nitrate/sulfonate/bicarbonate ABC transporter ATP-binding protein [Oceanospirillaceae bacterium]|uniref:ABC transporter ATP-binding protein n=1 Tax=unclassified Thalassolituus TaxID=2624967 RepID=UPI000C37847F|nr:MULTISPECIES: ABC transporter ATP-binding protein [unclassified Thalassolituus]MAS26367.1 nitrate/sulfonate/bicarbonate ABC transporter ATP-binding protein [Oceanospirillaceae bacterium]MBL34070.1 nitrate/sulfonate/bicarbonate ABC transporter ATP-binding protein [Oceanospirillaceae bacterium]MBS54490.1 nitrate/sulfonate/bicarbonate ABC transporter ATP-binding protein [Oceanospirillaceae bacterium]|tara:strand:- start:1731 stop:2582 length:852 start_codon:yes stop_codon:yes gene_type:complete